MVKNTENAVDNAPKDNTTARGTANEAANAAARAEGDVPDSAKPVAADAPDSALKVADTQQTAKDWPVPGDEGFVHPDGTQQSINQLADNKQAAADRVGAAEEANRLRDEEVKASTEG